MMSTWKGGRVIRRRNPGRFEELRAGDPVVGVDVLLGDGPRLLDRVGPGARATGRVMDFSSSATF